MTYRTSKLRCRAAEGEDLLRSVFRDSYNVCGWVGGDVTADS